MVTILKARYYVDGEVKNYFPEVSETVFPSTKTAREYFKQKFNAEIVYLYYENKKF